MIRQVIGRDRNRQSRRRVSMTGFRTTITALAPIALLTACGGGGGDSKPSATDLPQPASVVRVIDADTVDVAGTRFRLHGIDAPETRQTCRAMGRTRNCGEAATEALRARAEGMSCAGGTDLNAWLVANGWALAYLHYSQDYADEEA